MAKHLTIADVQKRLDPMPAAMSAKGLKQPRAEFEILANEPPAAWLKWHDGKGITGTHYERIRSDGPAEILAEMEAFIAALPPPEETRMKEFLTALSGVIELGRENGIAVEFINPLTEAMQRLSSNILTDQRAA